MSGSERFSFVQLEVAGSIGLESARYLARGHDERVLVVRVENAPGSPPRRLRRRRPREAQPEPEPPALPVTTLTVIRSAALGAVEEARGWLERVRADAEAVASEIAAAVALVNAALEAQRAAALDPHPADISAEHALAVRIGFGAGEAVAVGRWEQAIEIPRGERRRRGEALHPQGRIAEVLGGRERVPACVTLLLRARGDLDAGRDREAALQLAIGLETLLAESADQGAMSISESEAGADQQRRHEADLTELGERLSLTATAAGEALRGELAPDRLDELAETLEICERVLRRHRAYGK